MATTPNFSWVTPAPTDFVTDLPADFETFADAVDTDVWAIKGTADAALPETLIDAAGDLIYGSAADTAARLAIGTAGQVLAVNSGATAPEWIAAPGGGGMTQIATQDMAGISTVTFSSIPQTYNYLIITGDDLEDAAQAYSLRVQWNGITASVYDFTINGRSTSTTISNTSDTGSGVIGYGGPSSSNVGSFLATFPNYKTGNQLKYYFSICGNPNGGQMQSIIGSGDDASAIRDAITSITIFASGNLVDGDITLWGVK